MWRRSPIGRRESELDDRHERRRSDTTTGGASRLQLQREMGYSTSGFRRKRPPEKTRESSFLDRVAMMVIWSCACEKNWAKAFDLGPVWKTYFFYKIFISLNEISLFSLEKIKKLLKIRFPNYSLTGIVRNIRGWYGEPLNFTRGVNIRYENL
jgi:hypothetical protein